ncbi:MULTISPECIES: hypothetical protein [unclassified Spiroplasma]|uniref:hypothetical protein n=1 Tax=unclassified Spiroplasma TaxID=2637901 RepID=UPI0030CD4766
MKLLESKFILNTIENKNIASYFTNEITYNNYIYEDGSIVSETKNIRFKNKWFYLMFNSLFKGF